MKSLQGAFFLVRTRLGQPRLINFGGNPSQCGLVVLYSGKGLAL